MQYYRDRIYGGYGYNKQYSKTFFDYLNLKSIQFNKILHENRPRHVGFEIDNWMFS